MWHRIAVNSFCSYAAIHMLSILCFLGNDVASESTKILVHDSNDHLVPESQQQIPSERMLFSRTNIPRLMETDMIDLYHLRSFPIPLIHSDVGDFFIQSSGIALRSTQTSEIIILEYQPVNYSCSFLPIISRSPENNSRITLTWDTRADVFYRNELDIKYWQQSTFLARVNNVVYENYLKWVEEYVHQHAIFKPAAICSGSDKLSCFTSSQTWESFIADSLEVFSDLAVAMSAIIPPRASESQMISFMEPSFICLSSSDTMKNMWIRTSTFQPTTEVNDADIIHDINDNNSSSSISRRTNTDISSSSTGTGTSAGRHKDKPPHVVQEEEIANYYTSLLSCMQEYQFEGFYNALTSCFKEVSSFVHVSDNCYYHFTPRHPYTFTHEFFHDIPVRKRKPVAGADWSDIVIGSLLLGFGTLGAVLGLYKLKVIEWIWAKSATIRRRRVSSLPPAEGGYSRQASELPRYSDCCGLGSCMNVVGAFIGRRSSGGRKEDDEEFDSWSYKMRMSRLFGGFEGFGGGGGLGDIALHSDDLEEDSFTDELASSSRSLLGEISTSSIESNHANASASSGSSEYISVIHFNSSSSPRSSAAALTLSSPSEELWEAKNRLLDKRPLDRSWWG